MRVTTIQLNAESAMSFEPQATVTARASLLPLLLATCLDGLALVVLVSGRGAASSWIAPAALHLIAFGAAGLGTQAGRSQRALKAGCDLPRASRGRARGPRCAR